MSSSTGQQLRSAVDGCVQQVARGEADQAVAELRRILADVTGPPEFLERMGVEMQQVKPLLPLAEVAFERLTQIQPTEGMPVARLGACVVAQRDFERGEAILRRSVAIDPSGVWARTQLANLLERTNRLEDARTEATSAVELEPRSSAARLSLAQIEHRLGNLGDAKQHLHRALDADGLGDRLAMRIRNELGFVLDKLGEHDEAFAQFERAQATWATLPGPSRIDREAYPKRMEAFGSLIETEDFQSWPSSRPSGARPAPVFFVGFPRSGTTLLEQMLGTHPAIVGSEEEPFLGQALQELGAVGVEVPAGLRRIDEQQRAAVERVYWEKAEASHGPIGDRVLLDKMPLTIVELAAAYRIFPDAKVIVALRDPRDCVLSAFMQEFSANSAMVHTSSLDATAKLYEGAMGLWRSYRKRLPIAWMESKYEDLVADPEAQVRRLLEFIGLDWDAGVLEGGGSRVSRTPSYRAVGEKIHDRATKKWMNYRPQLEAVRDQLGPFVDAFGYGAWERADGAG